MVPGSPNTGPLFKYGTKLGAASTKESGDVETGVLVEGTLQELPSRWCELGMTVTSGLEMVAPTETLLPIARAAVRLGPVSNSAVRPPRLWIPSVFSIDIGR